MHSNFKAKQNKTKTTKNWLSARTEKNRSQSAPTTTRIIAQTPSCKCPTSDLASNTPTIIKQPLEFMMLLLNFFWYFCPIEHSLSLAMPNSLALIKSLSLFLQGPHISPPLFLYHCGLLRSFLKLRSMNRCCNNSNSTKLLESAHDQYLGFHPGSSPLSVTRDHGDGEMRSLA